MRLLIIGSLRGHIVEAARIAMARGVKVTQSDTSEAGLHVVRTGGGADVIFIDVNQDIPAFITSLHQERIQATVIACGIGNEKELAVQAIKAGAREYLPLPPNAELIAAVLESVVQDDGALLYQDPAMHRTVMLAEQFAPSDASVMITGESGTGKEVMARFIHKKSRRAERVFVSVNCAAIPDNLLESELFGHEKGAFTGAVARRVGKFEEAHGGTLLLDEISEMHPRLQAKLLRAIQEREIDRVGGSKPVPVDIRVLATSNRNLEEEVQKGNFREDLYFRLNVLNLRLPPLRQRTEDIEILAEHFLEKFCNMNGLSKKKMTSGAIEAMQRHTWRGNVRELENTIHRAVLLARGNLIEEDLIQVPRDESTLATPSPVAPKVGQTVAEVERELIIQTLGHCHGNRTHAATILGISIRTLRNKLRQYRMDTLPDHSSSGLQAHWS